MASFLFLSTDASLRLSEDGRAVSAEDADVERRGEKRVRGSGGVGCESGGVGCVEMGGCGVAGAYPSVPFLLGELVSMVVPSGCWPSLRGGILSFILSRPRASSKLRIFLVGEKP